MNSRTATPVRESIRPIISAEAMELYDEATQLFKGLAEGLVEKKDRVQVNCERMTRSAMITIECDPGDFGKLVGGGGNTVRSFHTIALVFSEKTGYKIRIHLIEPEVFGQRRQDPLRRNDNWDEKPLMKQMQEVCDRLFISPPKLVYGTAGKTHHVDVLLAPGEPELFFEDSADGKIFSLTRSLKTVFHAIAKAQGAVFSLDFIQQ